MPKRLLALNIILAATAVVFSFELVRILSTSRPLPTLSASPAALAAVAPKEEPAPARPPLPTYSVVATKNLFSPSRSETAAPAALTVAVKPVLHGVVIDGKIRLAYLEDPLTKRVVGYKPGDMVGDGQLERIEPDRVVIRRPEGLLEVSLYDPSKPKPAVRAVPTVPSPAIPPVVSPIPSVTPALPGVSRPLPTDPRIPAILRRQQQGAPGGGGAPAPRP